MVKITTKSEIPNGKMKEFKVKDKTIVIANLEGKYFAFDGLCTHMHCSLAGGFLEETKITCYCHGAQFDIKTGKVLAGPAKLPLKTYKVKVAKEDLQIEI